MSSHIVNAEVLQQSPSPTTEGFPIIVGARYQYRHCSRIYAIVTSTVGDSTSFPIAYEDWYEGEAMPWNHSVQNADGFREMYAIPADHMAQAVELLRGLVDNCAEYEAWQRPCLAYDNAVAFLASVGSKGVR